MQSVNSIDYAVIGDTTNTAARIQDLTKQTGNSILLADQTRTNMTGSTDGLAFVDEFDRNRPDPATQRIRIVTRHRRGRPFLSGQRHRQAHDNPHRLVLADQLRQLPDIQAYGNLRLRDLAQRGPASARATWTTAKDALIQQYGNVTVDDLLTEFEAHRS